MKKVFAILAIATLAACGSNNTTNVAIADSTAAQVDSTAVTANDSTTAEIKADSAATK